MQTGIGCISDAAPLEGPAASSESYLDTWQECTYLLYSLIKRAVGVSKNVTFAIPTRRVKERRPARLFSWRLNRGHDMKAALLLLVARFCAKCPCHAMHCDSGDRRGDGTERRGHPPLFRTLTAFCHVTHPAPPPVLRKRISSVTTHTMCP